MYYDGPKLLLRRTSAGQFFLAWWSDADADMERWVYLPVSESRLYQVLSGDIPSRQALSNPEDGYLFVTDVEYSGEVRNVVLTDIESIPNDALPRPDARLNIALPEEIGRVAHRDRAHVVDITLQSEDQETGRVAARVFGSFVANFQRLFDALARIHRWTGMDGVRTAEGGEGVTGAMIRARIWVAGRLGGGLQALLGAPMAAYSGCGERDGGIGHGKRRSRTVLARVCGDVGLAGGSVADGRRQAGSGMARSRARARLNCSSQGQRRGRCRVNRRAERVIRPAKAKTRRLRVLVVTVC